MKKFNPERYEWDNSHSLEWNFEMLELWADVKIMPDAPVKYDLLDNTQDMLFKMEEPEPAPERKPAAVHRKPTTREYRRKVNAEERKRYLARKGKVVA